MKIQDFGCNVCKERLENIEELIGIQQDAKCVWSQHPIEDCKIHICRPCFEELYRFWSNFEEG